MTTENRKIYGWEIEGFGDYAASDLGFGQRLRLSYEPLYEVAISSVYVLGLAALPSKIPTTVHPLDGHTTQSTMQILIGDIDRADATGVRMGRAAARFFWQGRPKAVARLQTGISASATSFGVDLVAGEDVPVAGDLIYIGREVMVIGSVSGAGSTRTLSGLARGQFASDAQVHELDDADVYLQNPVRQDRWVTLWEYDAELDTETVRWRGVVEDFEVSDETMVVSVTCRDLMGTFAKRKVAESRWSKTVDVSVVNVANVAPSLLMVAGADAGARGGVVTTPPFYPDLPAGFVPGTERYDTLSVENKGAAIEIDGECVVLRASNVSVAEPGFYRLYRHGIIGGLSREVSGGRVDADYDAKTMQACEVLVCDADSPLCYFKDDAGTASDHPAIIILNILTSTGSATWPGGGSHTVGTNGDHDWLPGHWGLAVPVAWVDVAAFTALASTYPTSLLRARAGYIGGGKDGADKSALDLLCDFAQAMCAYVYLTADARISIRRLADPGLGNIDASLDADDIAWADNQGEGQQLSDQKPIYAIELNMCGKGPGGDPARIITAGNIGQRRVSRFKFCAEKDKLDSTLIYGDPQTYEVTGKDIQLVAEVFRWRYGYTTDRLPVYRLRLVQGATLLSAGQWIALTHPYFINNSDFARGFTSHRCLILEHSWDVKDGTQEIVIVDASPVTGADTLISPAWRVSAVSSATSFTLDDNWFRDDDRAYFGSGRSYQLWTGDGQLRSTALAGIASAYNSGTGVVTLSQAFNNGGAVTPSVGDIVRLDVIAGAAVDWLALYTWLGDSSMLVDGTINPARWDI